jgi:hypothetical protein
MGIMVWRWQEQPTHHDLFRSCYTLLHSFMDRVFLNLGVRMTFFIQNPVESILLDEEQRRVLVQAAVMAALP